MSNMAYCRFQNTLNDLSDCEENMEDDTLSTEEKLARRRLIEMCRRIANEHDAD